MNIWGQLNKCHMLKNSTWPIVDALEVWFPAFVINDSCYYCPCSLTKLSKSWFEHKKVGKEIPSHILAFLTLPHVSKQTMDELKETWTWAGAAGSSYQQPSAGDTLQTGISLADLLYLRAAVCLIPHRGRIRRDPKPRSELLPCELPSDKNYRVTLSHHFLFYKWTWWNQLPGRGRRLSDYVLISRLLLPSVWWSKSDWEGKAESTLCNDI